MSPKKIAYENPLISNARLKQIYRAILRAHLLGQALPPSQRALTAAREAALVSASIDLTSRDLVLDAFSSPVLDFLRGASFRVGLKSRRILAESGSASRVISPTNATARLWSAIGIAASIKSVEAAAKRPKSSTHDSAVVLTVALSGEVPADVWQSALAHAAQYDLPIVFLLLPSAREKSRTSDATVLRAIAHRARVPAIPVDTADPVALYRVAQESIGHARIGGGPALIECVSFPATRAPHSAGQNAAILHLQDYILSRGIATRAWMDREASSFSVQIRGIKPASK